MTKLSADQAPSLAAALLTLRKQTMSNLSKQTGVQLANLSVWLRGSKQVISDVRVALLLDTLGVRGDKLRTDIVHEWVVVGNVNELKTALNLLLDPISKATIVCHHDASGDAQNLVFLEIPSHSKSAFIKLTCQVGLGEYPIINAQTMGFGVDEYSVSNFVTAPSTVNELSAFLKKNDDWLGAGESDSSMSSLLQQNLLDTISAVESRDLDASKKLSSLYFELYKVLVTTLEQGVPTQVIIDAIAHLEQ